MKVMRFAFLLFFVAARSVFSAEPNPPLKVGAEANSSQLLQIEQKSIVGRDLIFHRRYTEALEHFKKMEAEFPDSPIGTFGQMALYQAQMFENYDFRLDEPFQKASYQNEKITQRVLENPQSSAFDLFVGGASAGLRGFWLMRRDAPFKALGQSHTAQKAMEGALKKDPALVDVYLGFGMYQYWRSVFTSRIKILPFFADRRAEGLAQIEKAMREGRFSRALAQMSLAFSFYDSSQYDRALPLLAELRRNYPENVIVQNLLGDTLAMMGRHAEAHAVFDAMLQKTPEVYVALFFKGKIFLREGKFEEAKSWFERFLEHDPSPAWAAYALTDIGRIALKKGNDQEAFNNFKKAYQLYPDYSASIDEIRRLRNKKSR